MANGLAKFLNNIILLIFVFLGSYPAFSQYYYKDLITTRQVNENFKVYKTSKVNKVILNSFQGSEPVTEGFICEQRVNLAQNKIITYTKTADFGESYFTAFYNLQGLLVKTIDSTDGSAGLTTYQYDLNSRLIRLSRETNAADNSSSIIETHLWEYSSDGKPTKMIRVKNGIDTTTTMFTVDDKGNVAEENTVRKNVSQGKIYYYYDENNRLTDVVRYNINAGRLLPDYIFEYEETGELSTMTVVPEGSNDYQKWYYKYDDSGLKLVEFCYNKKSELRGKIEYAYSAGK